VCLLEAQKSWRCAGHFLVVKERFIVMEEKMTKEPAQSKPRGLLRKAFWTVAGVVGAGSLLRAKAASAHASGSEGPTTFTATGGATAVSAQSESGAGLIGFSESGAGVVANSRTGYGLSAASGTGVSVEAYSTSVVAVDARSNTGTGLQASSNSGIGAKATSTSNAGVYAQSDSGPGLHAVSKSDIGAILENPSGVAVQVKGRIQVQGDCIGLTALDDDQRSVIVHSPAATLNSLILLTPLGPCNSVLYVTRATGYFTITRTLTDRPSDFLDIAYLIVN
jgi:hypothetical protein